MKNITFALFLLAMTFNSFVFEAQALKAGDCGNIGYACIATATLLASPDNPTQKMRWVNRPDGSGFCQAYCQLSYKDPTSIPPCHSARFNGNNPLCNEVGLTGCASHNHTGWVNNGWSQYSCSGNSTVEPTPPCGNHPEDGVVLCAESHATF